MLTASYISLPAGLSAHCCLTGHDVLQFERLVRIKLFHQKSVSYSWYTIHMNDFCMNHTALIRLGIESNKASKDN